MNATQDRIRQIESTADALIASDEGTHSTPTTWQIFESIEGYRFAVKRHNGSSLSTWTTSEAAEQTAGTIRYFQGEMARMSALRAELRSLQKSTCG